MPDPLSLIQHQFGAHAQNYVASLDHARGDSLDRLLALTDPQPDWRALDVATGGGHTALALARRVRAVAALDLTAPMLAAARGFIAGQGLTNVTYPQAEASALPFPAACFDLSVCRMAPHHFPDVPGFVRDLARVTRPGGRVAVIDNVAPPDPLAGRFQNAFDKLRDPSHHWAYTAAEWVDFFTAAGLDVLAVEHFHTRHDFEAFCDRLSVPARTRLQLRAMLRQAPAAAQAALEPHFSADPAAGPLHFYLGEVLVSARKV